VTCRDAGPFPPPLSLCCRLRTSQTGTVVHAIERRARRRSKESRARRGQDVQAAEPRRAGSRAAHALGGDTFGCSTCPVLRSRGRLPRQGQHQDRQGGQEPGGRGVANRVRGVAMNRFDHLLRRLFHYSGGRHRSARGEARGEAHGGHKPRGTRWIPVGATRRSR